MKNPDEVITLIRSLNLGQIKKQLEEDYQLRHTPTKPTGFLDDRFISSARISGFIAFLEAASNQPRE